MTYDFLDNVAEKAYNVLDWINPASYVDADANSANSANSASGSSWFSYLNPAAYLNSDTVANVAYYTGATAAGAALTYGAGKAAMAVKNRFNGNKPATDAKKEAEWDKLVQDNKTLADLMKPLAEDVQKQFRSNFACNAPVAAGKVDFYKDIKAKLNDEAGLTKFVSQMATAIQKKLDAKAAQKAAPATPKKP